MHTNFYKGKKVLVTGHTGFKGSWLCEVLLHLGAEVIGYSLKPPTSPNLFQLAELEERMTSIIGDIRDFDSLHKALVQTHPQIVFHMAAQPIVGEGYRKPRYTYETNVMGTVNILECIRHTSSVKSFVNITTDKVYKNKEWPWGYRENEELDGIDPYSNSKSCSELVTHSYKNSFFAGEGATAISTVRAGNVIGGGDFAKDRIIPDCIRAALENKEIIVRNPHAIRPYQHVLEALSVYLTIAESQCMDAAYEGWYNVGPDDDDCIPTGALVDLFCASWGEGANWKTLSNANAPHEAQFLKLDSSKLKQTFGWKPRWRIDQAVEQTVAWVKAWRAGAVVKDIMDMQINQFMDKTIGCNKE